MDKYATILRYGLTYVLAPLAARKGLDAVATGNLVDVVLAAILAVLTAAPMVYSLLTRPSVSAMKVAVEADKILSGEKGSATVVTPANVPNLTVTPTRGNQG